MSIWTTLKNEIKRLQDRPFLEAAMAICALSALSGGRVTLAERYQVDTLLATLDRLAIYDPEDAINILDQFIYDIREDSRAIERLRDMIRRYADDEAASHALLRMAYLVISADGQVSAEERQAFEDLAGLLGVDPSEIILEITEKSGA